MESGYIIYDYDDKNIIKNEEIIVGDDSVANLPFVILKKGKLREEESNLPSPFVCLLNGNGPAARQRRKSSMGKGVVEGGSRDSNSSSNGSSSSSSVVDRGDVVVAPWVLEALGVRRGDPVYIDNIDSDYIDNIATEATGGEGGGGGCGLLTTPTPSLLPPIAAAASKPFPCPSPSHSVYPEEVQDKEVQDKEVADQQLHLIFQKHVNYSHWDEICPSEGINNEGDISLSLQAPCTWCRDWPRGVSVSALRRICPILLANAPLVHGALIALDVLDTTIKSAGLKLKERRS